MAQHDTKQHTIHVITLYDKINLDRDKIHDGVSILLKMDNSKPSFFRNEIRRNEIFSSYFQFVTRLTIVHRV